MPGPRTRKARMKGLYDTDVNTQIKKSNENPMILSLYDSLLKGKEHELRIETSRESRARSAGRECEISCTYRKIKGQSLEVISGLCFFLVQENDVVYTIKINFLFSYVI